MIKKHVILWLLFFGAWVQSAFALGQTTYVADTKSPGCFPLCAEGITANFEIDSNDFAGAIRAASDLQNDVFRVTGHRPALSTGNSHSNAAVVLIGTLGKSVLINDLIHRHKINVSAISGQWESFLIQVVPKPWPGVDQALVICGSDKRGTIYGLYDVSEQIGVSPWHFWEDVPVRHRQSLFIMRGKYIQGPPAVKYRGIFINDEAPDLTGWAKERFGGYNHAFYTNVFELLLRLKANYLWPAMWDNCFKEDDPLNAQLADDYGIVMGTSHVEPMMRADKEWNRLGYTQSQWNFQTHSNALKQFWQTGLERNRPYENIITLAMRGKIDTPMSETANISLLEEIVASQRKIITDVYHTNAAAVPQLWALYKEVQEYYEKGMRVPDDVTLLWCDDNWGNLRRLPSLADRNRPGGSGIYYHFDYVGGPRNYKWINSVSLPRVWEQMQLAQACGATRIWIANVGHLQHVALPTEFFLNLAWNPKAWPKENISKFTQLWAEREFGTNQASTIASIVDRYASYSARRKPELLSPDTYSLSNYQEADRVSTEWQQLVAEAEKRSDALPSEARDAFFELVLYPVEACANLNELYLATAKNRLYAAQGRASAADFAKQARACFQKDAALTYYYNQILAGGKWNHMMDQTHIGYTSWQQPNTNIMPSLLEPTLSENANSVVVKTNLADSRAHLPAWFHGFVESDGYVSMNADHFTRKTGTSSAHWEMVENLGRTGNGMTIFPMTANSILPPKRSARLEYQMYIFKTGKVGIDIEISPTLNFIAGRGLRLGISMDDSPTQIINAVPENYTAGDANLDWQKVVSDNIRHVQTEFTLDRPGKHTLKVWMVDPGVVLQKLVVDCGGVQPSYLGPPESPLRH